MNEKKEKIIKQAFALVAITAMIILVGYQIIFSFFDFNQKSINDNVNTQINLEKNEEITIEINKEKDLEKILSEDKIINENKKIQEKIYIKIPFTSQSPYADWDELHNEACEEASLIMVDAFLKNKTLSAEKADKEIVAMVDWQIENWGEHRDLNLIEIKELAEKYFGYQDIRIVNVTSADDIKTELSNGNPVILPLAGRFLGNPYYRQPGPYYHMLVVVGYEKNKFITHDPGTRRGEDFSYSQDVILNAIHDWPGEERDILTGEKLMLIIEK